MTTRRLTTDGVDAIKTGNLVSWLEDPYPFFIGISWLAFFMTISVFYLILNALFALLYWSRPGSITGPHDFLSAFYFSIETMTTVGYGALAPNSLYGHVVSICELVCGIFIGALITGLVFARFSKPKAKLLFSNVCVIAPYGEGLALMARVANRRTALMSDVSARLTFSLEETGSQDTSQRKWFDLPLERSFSPVFGLVWTLIHRISDDSPIAAYGDALPRSSAVIASITATDDSIAATVTARKTYAAANLIPNRQFKEVVSRDRHGTLVVRLNHLDDLV